MKKTDLGTKRKCDSCEAKFYDLNRDPITCPKCNHVLVVEVLEEVVSPPSKPAESKSDVEEVKPADGPEVISLEDVDSDELGAEIQSIEDEEEDMGSGENNTYIESDDESDMAEIVTETDDENES